MKSNYDLIYEIDNLVKGIYFEKIIGHSLVGDVRSDALKHPIQYRALTNLYGDDPFEGIGWSPGEALRDLLKQLKTL